VTHNPNRAWDGFDLSGITLLGHLSTRVEQGSCNASPSCATARGAPGVLRPSLPNQVPLMDVSLETPSPSVNCTKVRQLPQKWQAEKEQSYARPLKQLVSPKTINDRKEVASELG